MEKEVGQKNGNKDLEKELPVRKRGQGINKEVSLEV